MGDALDAQPLVDRSDAPTNPLGTIARTASAVPPGGPPTRSPGEEVEDQPMPVVIDELHRQRTRPHQPCVGIRLALPDHLAGLHVDRGGAARRPRAPRTTPSRGATLASTADTRRGRTRRCARVEEVRLAKAKLDAVIASVPIFESLSKRHLKKVAGLTSTVAFDAGDTVIQGGRARRLVLRGGLRAGQGDLRRQDDPPVDPGDHFGEISLLDRPRSHVVAETPMSLLKVPRSSFLRLVKDDADLAQALLASLARMVRRVDRLAREVSPLRIEFHERQEPAETPSTPTPDRRRLRRLPRPPSRVSRGWTVAPSWSPTTPT